MGQPYYYYVSWLVAGYWQLYCILGYLGPLTPNSMSWTAPSRLTIPRSQPPPRAHIYLARP